MHDARAQTVIDATYVVQRGAWRACADRHRRHVCHTTSRNYAFSWWVSVKYAICLCWGADMMPVCSVCLWTGTVNHMAPFKFNTTFSGVFTIYFVFLIDSKLSRLTYMYVSCRLGMLLTFQRREVKLLIDKVNVLFTSEHKWQCWCDKWADAD